jgi:catechol 2,3-dioxygenase-like lactoylglutathione lyase family enzyme
MMRRAAAIIIAFAFATVPVAAEAKGFAAIVTKDAGRIADWYVRAFDLRIVRTIAKTADRPLMLILDGPPATLEIRELPSAAVPAEQANRRLGYFKSGFAIGDVDAMLPRWKAMGVTIVAGPFDDAQPPMRSIVLLDPDGNSVHVFSSPARAE